MKFTLPLWYKIFNYIEKGNKGFEHMKQGIFELNEIFKSYEYEVGNVYINMLVGGSEYIKMS